MQPISGGTRSPASKLTDFLATCLALIVSANGYSQTVQPYEISIESKYGHPHLSWSNTPGAVYQILVLDDQVEGQWTPSTLITADAELISWADESAMVAARFYQVTSVTGFEQLLGQRLQSVLDTTMSDLKIGVTAAVLTPEHGLWVGTAGRAWSEAQALPVKPQTRFDVASITKTFIATLILQLQEEGHLLLHDRLDQHLSLPTTVTNRIDGGITIRQLLNHTSGVGDLFAPEGTLGYEEILAEPLRFYTPEELIEFAGPRSFAPGTSWRYSNCNFILLGMVIKSITGRPVSEVLRQRILDRLHLGGTFFLAEETVIGESAVGHQDFLNSQGNVGSDGVLDEISFNGIQQHQELVVNPSFDWGLANLASTPRDLVHWSRSLYGRQLLDEVSLNEMVTTVPGSGGFGSAAYPWEYGLGTMKFTTPSGIMYGHSGREIGCDTIMVYSPQRDWAVTVAINQWNRSYIASLTRQLVDVLAQSLLLVSVQPESQTATSGTDVTFNAVASSEYQPLSYQWQFNGTQMADATNSMLLLTNVQTTHSGDYTVVVADNAGRTSTDMATLTVLVAPFLVEHPQSQTVTIGDTATFSVAITNIATLPITYKWRKGSVILETQVLEEHGSSFTITNVQPGDAGNYRVSVSNPAFSTPGYISDWATLTVE